MGKFDNTYFSTVGIVVKYSCVECHATTIIFCCKILILIYGTQFSFIFDQELLLLVEATTQRPVFLIIFTI